MTDKYYVFERIDYALSVEEFETKIEMLKYVAASKHREDPDYKGNEFERVIFGREVEIEPVNVTTEWRIKDDGK